MATYTVIVVTTINTTDRKWTWDLACVDDSAVGDKAYPIASATLMARSEADADTFVCRGDSPTTTLLSPTNWLCVLSASRPQQCGGSVKLTAEQRAFFDATCSSGVLPKSSPEGIALNPAFSNLTPFRTLAPVSNNTNANAASTLVTVKDKLENKFSITVSKRLLTRFKEALMQRVVTLSRYRLPGSISADSEEGLAMMLYHYLIDELWKHSEKLVEVSKKDHEDFHAKQLNVLRLKQPICKGDVCLMGYVGSAYRWMVVLSNAELHEVLANPSGTAPQILVNLTERKLAVGRGEPEGTWIVKAEATKATEPDTVNINVVLKPRSTDTPTSFTVPIVASPLPEEADDIVPPPKVKPVIVTSGTLKESLPPAETIAAYALPDSNQSTGPQLVDIPKIDVAHSAETVTTPDVAQLKMEAKAVTVSHGISSGPTFNHYITATVQVTNASKDSVSLSHNKVSMQYKDTEGKWVDMEKPQLVVQGWNSMMNACEEDIDLTEVAAAVIGVRAHTVVSGSSGSDNWERSRAHRSFPQPLNVRITLTESVSGAAHTLEMQQANSPVTYKTKDEVKSDWSAVKLPLVVFADDVDAGRRHYAGVYTSKDGLHLRHSEGRYYTYDTDDIIGVAYRASKAKSSEFFMEDLSTKMFKFYALCDIEAPEPVWYGIKVEVTTPTSSSSGVCHVEL